MCRLLYMLHMARQGRYPTFLMLEQGIVMKGFSLSVDLIWFVWKKSPHVKHSLQFVILESCLSWSYSRKRTIWVGIVGTGFWMSFLAEEMSACNALWVTSWGGGGGPVKGREALGKRFDCHARVNNQNGGRRRTVHLPVCPKQNFSRFWVLWR